MYRKYVKRILDIAVVLVAMPLFIIICAVVIPCILLDDFGPVFYKGERLGKNGTKFKMYKFRSMKVNSQDIRNEDGTTYNSENDPRVTRVGKVLRKWSIDEIPQIINVIIGDMSIIGPRPDLPDALSLYSEKTRQKLDVLPGITGYSQAHYRNESTLEQRFEGDVFYANNISFKLDVSILIKSIIVVLKRENVYRN